MTTDKNDRTEELLEQVVNLLGILVARSSPASEKTTQREQIVLLGSAGLKSKQIADLLTTTPNTVSVALSTAKKQGPKKAMGKNTSNN